MGILSHIFRPLHWIIFLPHFQSVHNMEKIYLLFDVFCDDELFLCLRNNYPVTLKLLI